MNWQEANKWEQEWHGNCANSYNEETKQYVYSHLMGLDVYATNYYGQRGWDLESKSVLDIGCGPYSILLKTKAEKKTGIDPCPYPAWVKMRYKECGIEFFNIKAEEMDKNFDERNVFDLAIGYNVLQHVENPEKIVKNALKLSKVVHWFDWIAGISDGHIQALTEGKLNKWFGGEGKLSHVSEDGCVGLCWYGIFKGDHYEK